MMTATTEQPPILRELFKASAQNPKTPQDSFFLFVLLMKALQSPPQNQSDFSNAVQEAGQDTEINTDNLSSTLQQAVEAIFGLASDKNNPDRALPFNEVVAKYTGFKFDNHSQTLLNPALAKAMQTDDFLLRKVNFAFKEAKANGLDGNLFANQLWQESGFKSNATSSAGAKGIAQFTAGTGARYGLKNDDDFYNPWQSISAGAKHMGDLTRQFGDQRLALVAYNGGAGAITKTVGRDASIGEWIAHMQEQRAEKGAGPAHAWRNETYGYLQAIDSSLWHSEKRESAISAMAHLQPASAGRGPGPDA